MTKVLITGGCGFIGSNLVEYLLEKTLWTFVILDNLTSGNIENIKKLRNFDERVKFYEGDIVEISDISKCVKGCDYIVNLAAQTSVINSIQYPFEDEQINILGMLNILKIAVDNNIKKIIQASSAAAVGNQEQPMHELKIPIPISPYGASKLAAEAYCSAFSESYNINCIVLRFSNIYGPISFNKKSVVAKYIKQSINGEEIIIYGNGKQTRDFIYVKDICKGIYLAMVSKISGYDIFQLGTGVETSINSLLEDINKIFKEKSIKIPKRRFAERRKGDILRNFSNITKAKQKLGFSIDFDLRSGLKSTIDWFLDNFN